MNHSQQHIGFEHSNSCLSKALIYSFVCLFIFDDKTSKLLYSWEYYAGPKVFKNTASWKTQQDPAQIVKNGPM